MTGCSASLAIIREMQTKITMRYHFTQVRMAIKNKYWQVLEKRIWRKGNPSALLVGMQTGTATVENSMELPQKNKNGTTFDPVTSLQVVYPKNPKIPVEKNLCTPMFTAALFIIAKCWKQPKWPLVNEWIKK